jgi:hypothetical protein
MLLVVYSPGRIKADKDRNTHNEHIGISGLID